MTVASHLFCHPASVLLLKKLKVECCVHCNEPASQLSIKSCFTLSESKIEQRKRRLCSSRL